jgi:hypothetical protein
MAKSSFTPPPKTCIETKQLKISFLREHGMLQPGHRRMQVTWSAQGSLLGNIVVESIINPEADSYLVLRYTWASGKEYEYIVELVRVASNLPGSTAGRYYMLCPVSGRRASILYLHHGTELFAHRQAYPNKPLYYDSQLELKRDRGLAKHAQVKKEWQRVFFDRKYRKTTYAGQETKWFTTLEWKTLRARGLTYNAMLRVSAKYR